MTREFDGFYFLPGENDDELKVAYFKMNSESIGAPVDVSPIGDTFHIAFFTKNEKGLPEFDDSFEAIFADPTVYVKNLVGHNLFGCIFRKTTTSSKWWENYLNTAKEGCNSLKELKSV